MASEDGGGKMVRKSNVDKISSLPDEILSQILSLLPTKCAFGTSILSNRWKYLWTSITCLHFETDDSYYYKPKKDSYFVRFATFVDHVVARCNPSKIHKLTLHCNYYMADLSRVKAWIDEAIKRKVNELDIDCPVVLPSSVFSCRTLTVLRLRDGRYYGQNMSLINLPCLKVLHLELCCSDKGFMEKLIRGCPMLEDFTLGGSLGDIGYKKGEIFMICAPTLRSLWIQLCPFDCSYNYNSTYKISLTCPNLEHLHLKESFVDYDIKGDFSSLVKANMDIADLSSCCHHHAHRHGSSFRRKGMYRSNLPKFHKLACLKVIIRGNRFWKMLSKFFRNSPCLEILSIEQHEHEQRLDESNLSSECTWIEPKSPPTCLRSHLAVINIEGFKGRKRELQLLNYCLGNAKVLQKVNINCQGLTQAEETQFCMQLLKFPRASRFCVIQFNGDFMSNL